MIILNRLPEEVEKPERHQSHEQNGDVEDVAECLFVKGQLQRLQVGGLARIADPNEVKVVKDGDHRIDGGNDHNGEMTRLKGADKQEELAGETARRRDPRQRESGDGQRESQ